MYAEGITCAVVNIVTNFSRDDVLQASKISRLNIEAMKFRQFYVDYGNKCSCEKSCAIVSRSRTRCISFSLTMTSAARGRVL